MVVQKQSNLHQPDTANDGHNPDIYPSPSLAEPAILSITSYATIPTPHYPYFFATNTVLLEIHVSKVPALRGLVVTLSRGISRSSGGLLPPSSTKPQIQAGSKARVPHGPVIGKVMAINGRLPIPAL